MTDLRASYREMASEVISISASSRESDHCLYSRNCFGNLATIRRPKMSYAYFRVLMGD